MKRFILVLLFLVFLVPIAYADRNTSTIAAYNSSRTLVKLGGWKVYRVSFIATSAKGSFAIYDSLTYAGNTISTVKAEGQEATAFDSKFYNFTNKPIEGSTGLYLDVSHATVILEYE